MHRAIAGYHQDDEGEWVAELACGHGQHVRHRPPFQVREWVLHPDERAARIGAPLDCSLCDRTELPKDLVLSREGPLWTDESMPAGLRSAAGSASA